MTLLLCGFFFLLSTAPNPPHPFTGYTIRNESDFAQQTSVVNIIDDVLISQEMKIICYNQSIYDDLHLEQNEYLGLSLGVRDNQLTTVDTQIKPMYGQASILILDNDSEHTSIAISAIPLSTVA